MMSWPIITLLCSGWPFVLSTADQLRPPPVDSHPADSSPRWMQLQTAAARMFCPTHCRCPDQHSTVVNCHRAGLRRVPFPLPEGTIVLDLDRNRIGIMTNESLGGSSSGPVTVASSGHEDAGSGCGQLEIISIQDNGLTRIEAGAFAALVQLRILRLGGNRLKALPVGLFDSCRRLQVLDLHDNLLTGAPPDHVMYHVHGLVSLNVSHNRLTSPVLGPGFRYVTQLGDIDMSGNDFPTIDSDAFIVMRYWDDRVERRINLSACNIRRVHPAALLPVRRLRSISVSGNPHLAVEDVRAAIRNNESSVTRYLETFEFEWNSAFRSFGDPSELFSEPAAVHLDHVTELGLAGNRIRSIPTGAFHAFLTPSSTNASQNVTPNGAIRSIVGLRRLDLSWNYLTSIDAGLAEMGDTLERLSLTGNRIANLDDDDDDDNNNRSGLQRFQRLLELDLAHNELNRLTGNVLRRGPFELRRLNVGYNRIRLIGDESLPLGLEFFIAPGNRLTDVGFLRRLPRLRVVDVSDNAIVRLGGDVFASVVFGFPPTHRQHKPVAAAAAEHDNGDGTTARRHPPTATPVVSANFSRNEISYVEPDAFRLVAFDVLDLSENRLTHVSPFGWHFVDILLLDGNQLSSVEADVFLEGDGPRELYVRRNRLQSLAFPGSMRNRSNGFESAVSRTMLLDVSDNPEIGNFLERPNGAVADPPPPGVFDLRRLEVLRAERTNLRRLPTEFTNRLRSLRVLDVSGNQLEDVNGRPRQLETDRQDAAFGALAHLHEIDISRNRLTQFPVELLRGDGSELRVVHLADNPWRCNCSSLALCRLQTIERLVRSDADDEHDDDVTDRTRCNFASFGGDPVVSVSVSLVDLCRVDSAFRSRCSASSAFGTALAAGDIVIYRGTTVSWKLVLGVVAALTGLTVFPLAALVVWHFGVTASGRRRQMRRCRRDMVSGGIRRAKSGGYHVVDETALNGADHEDTDCTQPL